MLFRASRYAWRSPWGLSRSSDWRRMFCLLLKSLLSRVRMSCGVVDEARVADYNTEMIVTWIRNSAASCIPEEIRECMYDCVKIWADEKKKRSGYLYNLIKRPKGGHALLYVIKATTRKVSQKQMMVEEGNSEVRGEEKRTRLVRECKPTSHADRSTNNTTCNFFSMAPLQYCTYPLPFLTLTSLTLHTSHHILPSLFHLLALSPQFLLSLLTSPSA